MNRIHINRKKRKKSAPPLEQELSHGRVLGEANCAVESIPGLRCFPKPLQKVSANCPVGLITGDSVQVDPIEYRQPCFRSTRFGDRSGVSNPRAERRRYADQLLVEQHDCIPLSPAAARPLSVDRLNRGLELKPAGATATRCLGEMAFRFFD